MRLNGPYGTPSEPTVSPDADEMQRSAPRIVDGLEEFVVLPVSLPFRKELAKGILRGGEVLAANEHLAVLARHVDLVDLGKVFHVGLLHEADKADEAGKAAHGVGAARKPEQEDLVAVVEIVGQKRVFALHVAGEADAKRATEKLIDTVPGSDTGMVVDQLRGVAVVEGAGCERAILATLVGARPGASR